MNKFLYIIIAVLFVLNSSQAMDYDSLKLHIVKKEVMAKEIAANRAVLKNIPEWLTQTNLDSLASGATVSIILPAPSLLVLEFPRILSRPCEIAVSYKIEEGQIRALTAQVLPMTKINLIASILLTLLFALATYLLALCSSVSEPKRAIKLVIYLLLWLVVEVAIDYYLGILATFLAIAVVVIVKAWRSGRPFSAVMPTLAGVIIFFLSNCYNGALALSALGYEPAKPFINLLWVVDIFLLAVLFGQAVRATSKNEAKVPTLFEAIIRETS